MQLPLLRITRLALLSIAAAIAGVMIGSIPAVVQAATTGLNLVEQVTGILAIANGGTGATTAAADTVFAGPASGSAAAPTFRIINYQDSNAIPFPNTRRFVFSITQNTLLIVGDGLAEVAGAGPDVGFTTATSTNSPLRWYQSGAVSGNSAGASGNITYKVGRNVLMQFNGVLITGTTSERYWVCLTDQTQATMAASATPTGSWACIRYDTGAGDTNFMCITSNAGTRSSTSTGVAADTNQHSFEIKFDDSVPNVTCKVDGTNTTTMTTNLPASGILMRYVTSLTTLSANKRKFGRAWYYAESDL